MKKKFLLMTILMIVSAFSYNLYAQTDVTELVGTTVNDWHGGDPYGSSVERYYGSFPCAEHPLYQQITGLDAGVYLATLKATSNLAWIGSDLVDGDATYAYVYASNGTDMDKSYFPAHRATGISTYYDRSVVVEIAENQTLELGLGLDNLYLSNWHTIQIVSLMKYDSFDELVGPLKNPLKAKLDEVNSYYTNSDDNPNETAKNAFKTAIDAGQAIYDSKTTYSEVVEAVANGVFEQAIADLEAAYEIYALSGAIPHAGYPFDITFKIVNPTFGNNDATGWTYSGVPGFQTFGNAEYFQSNFDIYQTISDMPQAKYLLKVKAFQRPGPYADVISAYVAAEDKEDGTFGVNAEIYVNNASKKIKNAASPMRTSALGKGGNEASSEGYYIPDDMNSADKYFIADYYENEAEIICTTGDVKFGFRCTNGTGDRYWTIFDDFRLYLTDAIDMSAYEDAWAAAVAAAEQAITDYPNVTGDELTALSTAMTDEPEETVESYQQKTKALQDATEAFIAAAPSYDAYVAEKAIAQMIGVNPEEVISIEPKTAAEAAEGVNNLKVAEFEYVDVTYPYDYELVVGTFDTWEGTATVAGQPATPNHLNNEHWSGQPHDYYEQDASGWGNANGWTIQYQKTVTLPAGDYMLKVSARSSALVTSSVSCTATTNTVSLPSAGNATKGIDLDGNASFTGDNFANQGKGFGWEWRFLPFSLDAETEVTMTFYGETNKQYQWMSISDGTLLSIQEVNLYATQDDYDELNTVLADLENLILGFDVDEFAPYNNVPFIEAYEAAIAIDQDIDNLRADVRAAIDALNEASFVVNTEEVNAVYDGDFSLEEAHEIGDNVILPGWTTVSGNTRFILKDTETYPALTDAEAQTALFVHPGTYEYGHTTGYTMPLDAYELYVLTFKYCSWQYNSNRDFTATILDEEGNVVASKSYGNVQGGLDAEGSLKAVKLYFTPEVDGNYILSLNASGNSAFTDVKIMKAVLTDLVLLSSDTEAPEEQFAGTVTTDRVLLEGLNTLVFPFETTKEEIGATTVLEYTGTSVEEGGLTLNFSEVETLMPNVPYAVLLDADAAAPLSFEFKEVTPSENLTVVDAGHEFDFIGTYVDIPKGNDIIKNVDYVAGVDAFKKAKGGNRVAAYRAYLKRVTTDEPTNVSFNFDGYIVEGIEAVELLNSLSGDIYNLNGQKVNRTQRGIYIINGQKVVVK